MLSPHTLQKTQIFSLIPTSPFSISNPNSSINTQTLTFSKKPISLPLCISSNSSSHYPLNQNQNQPAAEDDDDDDRVVGDCVVFEEDIFEDPYLKEDPLEVKLSKPRSKAQVLRIKEQMLVPEEWKQVHAEINMTKQERRKIANTIEFGSRIQKKDIGVPLIETKEYLTYRDYKLAQLNPILLDKPEFESEEEEVKDPIVFDKPEFESEEEVKEKKTEVGSSSSSRSSTGRVKPRSPRMEVYHGSSLDDISEFFKSGDYDKKTKKKSEDPPLRLFSQEERYLMNRRTPNVADATSEKWLPLHTLTASGEFYLTDALLKFNVDINAADKNGLTALHKAIICKKQAVTNYLLRESANPFVRDRDGATLMHYAVRTASLHTVKILLLYNVDINLADEDGWTPLHLAVQSLRSDMVRLLLIKGADKTLKNGDGLTPLDLCLYYGQDTRTYELIRLLKLLPKTKKTVGALITNQV